MCTVCRWESHSRMHKHTHITLCNMHWFCNTHQTPPIYVSISVHVGSRQSWQAADIQMNVSGCLPSSVQCSPANVLPDYSIPYHLPTPTGPSNLISLDCLAMHANARHTHICPHSSRAILHPWLTTPIYVTTHVHTHTLTALCTHSVSHANLTAVGNPGVISNL